jgi:hypothetical protein
LTAQDQLIGFGIDRAPPFSATPTTVAAFADGAFLSYVGCPIEVMSTGALPPLKDKVLRLKSFCASCVTRSTMSRTRPTPGDSSGG